MTTKCGPDSEVFKALISIIPPGNKINEAGAEAARTYLATQLKPIADEATTTLLEAVVTQIVFFFVILLIFLIVCVVICSRAVGLSPMTVVGIIVLFIIISVVFLAVISVAAINSAREAVTSAATELMQLDTPQDLLDTLNGAANAYLTVIGVPCI